MDQTEDCIAVIGIGCNFPGGEGVDNFWRVLFEGRNCVSEIPPERFSSTLWYDPDDGKPGKTQTRRAAFINGFNEFDHKFFGITEAEANFMDPQQKLLLHCTYRALEDAGISMESISGSRTGVIIGLMNRDFETLKSDSPSTINHYNATGTAMSIAANRVSFTFNLTGPSFAIDSACSSSLVALHLACQSLKQGDCEMAVCGGVSCMIEPRVFVALTKAKMISPEGISQPFSKNANGYGRGEGCGIVLLKPLKNAIRDCNKIWGIITKTAVNQDGRHVSPITKPSLLQQEELLRHIYSETDLVNVQYIEAHGTGTMIGDPTEATSIANVIAKAKPATKMLKLGSVKGNIGHTESAAGVAGLIKVLLMMRHETIVPTLYYSDDNACIDVKSLKLDIPTKVERWEQNGCSERVAGINSFGFGGTNAHAIVKEYKPRSVPMQIPKNCPNVFVISAATEKMMQASIRNIQQKLSNDCFTDLQELSYTSECGRSHLKHKYRKALLATSISELQQQLTSTVGTKVESTRSDLQVVFVFCGNGVAYRGMCRQLLQDEPIFREKISEVEKAFSKYKCIDICKKLSGDGAEDDFGKPDVVQPLLFAVQAGIVTLLKQWGIKPDIVLGHSVGEVAAAYCSGLLCLDDAAKVIYHRSALQSKVLGGKMLVVGNVAMEDILNAIEAFRGSICVAAYNSPQSCTLSGEEDAIDILHKKLAIVFADKNVFLYVLDVPAAYHSPRMDAILNEIENNIQTLNANVTDCQLFSTVTGEKSSLGDFCRGSYWAKNVRQPVLFEQTLKAITQDQKASESMVFVEISPRKALQRNILETIEGSHVVLSSTEPGKESHTILSTVAKLFELGVTVDWHKVYKGYETIPTELPVYLFETTRNEVCFEQLRKGDQVLRASHPLIGPDEHGNTYTCNLSLATAPYLWDHKSNGVPIVPGTLYIELAYASIFASLKSKKPLSSLKLGIVFYKLCALNSDNCQLTVTLDHSGKQCTFNIDSSASTHASGTYILSDGGPLIEETCICLDTVSQRCMSVIQRNQLYSVLDEAGFEYGPVFRQLQHVHIGEEYKEAMAPVEVPEELLEHFHEYFIHPVLLDYFLQMAAVVAMQELAVKQGFPTAIASIIVVGPLPKQMVMYLRASQNTSDFIEVCGCFTDTGGKVLIELIGVRISFINPCSMVRQLFYHNEILSITSEQSPLNRIKAIVFEESQGVAQALRPFLDSESITVDQEAQWVPSRIKDLLLSTKCLLKDVIFIWNLEDLSYMTSEKTLELLVDCCMRFRQIVLALKDSERQYTVRVVTYRSTEGVVSYISPGFVSHGLTRAYAAEIPELTFQLIDLASLTNEDIEALVQALNTSTEQEIMIENGNIKTTRIVRTSVTNKCTNSDLHSVHLKDFSLWTSNPYRMMPLSVCPRDAGENVDLDVGFVEVELKNICVHSADYFPVSTSQLQFGETFYWNEHATQSHKVLALDFSGVVTAVGKNVRNVKVGDHIASCYPVVSSSKVRVPGVACFNTNRLPYLEETPCVSMFLLAWEILQIQLANVKLHQKKLAIISSNPASIMMKVLALTANRSGWNVSSLSLFSVENLERRHAVVFLTPFDHPWIGNLNQPMEELHFVFVSSSYKFTPPSLNRFAAKHDNIHVHNVDVLDLLQKAKLQAHNKMISNWLMSLGFVAESLPLKTETIQSTMQDETVESYFTTKTVKQVILCQGSLGCPVFPTPLQPKKVFKQRSVYIVTGGLSGLGWETVRFIAQNGGDCIATLSRKDPSDKMQVAVDDLQKRFYVEVLTLQCDVSVSTQVDKAISKIQQRFPSCPVKGVFHSAVVLQDGLAETLDRTLFLKVLQPKICGALNLHYATLHYKLDYFVCYSSVSSFIGNASQSNYAAANSFLDTFCQYRRNLGLIGQSINWGPLNLGLLQNKDNFHKFFKTKGLMTMDICEIHEALKTCLLLDKVQQMICKFNFENLQFHVCSQNLFLRKRLSALMQIDLKDQPESETVVGYTSLSTQESVRKIVSDLFNVNVNELNDNATLCALGIDSMLAMTLQNKVFQETGFNVPLVKILDPKCTTASLITAVSVVNS